MRKGVTLFWGTENQRFFVCLIQILVAKTNKNTTFHSSEPLALPPLHSATTSLLEPEKKKKRGGGAVLPSYTSDPSCLNTITALNLSCRVKENLKKIHCRRALGTILCYCPWDASVAFGSKYQQIPFVFSTTTKVSLKLCPNFTLTRDPL